MRPYRAGIKSQASPACCERLRTSAVAPDMSDQNANQINPPNCDEGRRCIGSRRRWRLIRGLSVRFYLSPPNTRQTLTASSTRGRAAAKVTQRNGGMPTGQTDQSIL